MPLLCVVNYGSGNIAAISSLCERQRIPYRVVDKVSQLASASHFLLPGVGAFDPTIQTLAQSGLVAALRAEVYGNGKPILGICVGMHLLADRSDEGVRPGLGWVPGHVRSIDTQAMQRPPHLPHMGWNDVSGDTDDPLLRGIDLARGFYFLHSYFFDARESGHIVGRVCYGYEFPCIVRKEHVVGAQFHPEKSHANGIRFLRNFLGLQ